MCATLEEQLIKATTNGDLEKLNTLLQNPELDINSRIPEHGFSTAMEIAVKRGKADVALKILEHPNYDIAAIDRSGKTILHHVTGDLQQGAMLAKILLNTGADEIVNVQNIRGETALHRACARGNPSVIKEMLIVPTILPSLGNNYGETPLMAAIKYGILHRLRIPDICNLLLDSNASCNEPAQTLSVSSPLRTAIRAFDECMVTRLLEEGAATTFQIPLELVLENNEKAVMKTTLFESENLATYALNICQDPDVPFECSISIAHKVVSACPLPPHYEAVFQLYAHRVKKSKRGQMDESSFDKLNQMTDISGTHKQLFSLIYKCLGPSVEGNELQYLMTKYQLSVEKDAKLIMPFTTMLLRLLTTLQSRKWIVEETGTRNVVKAISVGKELIEGFEHLVCHLMLDDLADYFLTKFLI